jgi:putative hydrolase of the HAD superfamily
LIQAITFDFWDTLFVSGDLGDLRRWQIKRALEGAGYTDVAEAHIERAIGRAWREWYRVWEGEQRTFGARRWVSLVLADLGANLTEPEREALVHAMATSAMTISPPLVDGVNAVLPRLAGRYRLGLICDTGLSPGWMLRELMASHGVLRFFTHLTFSDELGISKPRPEPFLTTLARLGVPPGAAVHIGDFPRTDIAGAQGVGMRTIRFTGSHDRSDGTVRADAEIASYSELEPLLEQWEDSS